MPCIQQLHTESHKQWDVLCALLHRAILLAVSPVNTFVAQDVARYQSRGFTISSILFVRRLVALVVEARYAVCSISRQNYCGSFIRRRYTKTTVTNSTTWFSVAARGVKIT